MAPSISKPAHKGASSGGAKPLGSASRVNKKNAPKRPPPTEMKSKPRTMQTNMQKKKKRVYTEKELDLPELNAITPVGVVKPKGKKKGKTFVDDQEGMMTILAMVNAEKEGQIESKMMKARQLEEIREAKRKETEARIAEKKNKLENVKESIRNKKKGKNADKAESTGAAKSAKGKKKSVAFA